MRPSPRRFLALLFSLALVLTACGGEEAAGPGDGTQTEEQPDSTTEPTDDPTTTEGSDGVDWDATVSAANEEGKVVLYAAPVPAILERVNDGFSEAYPEIQLEYLRGASGELITKVDQEIATGVDGADVVVHTELGWFSELAEADELVELTGPSEEGWPEQYAGDGGLTPVLTMEAAVIPYNTELVETPPTDYTDLLTEDYTGRVVTTDVVSTFLTAWYGWLEETRGEDFLQALADQNPSLVVGTPPAVQAVAAGEHAASAWSNISGAKAVKDEGAPIDFVLPSPALGIPFAGGVLANAQRPNAAQVFMDWLMSPEGQIALTGDGWGASPLGVEGSLDISVIEPWNPDDWPEDRVEEFNARWEGIFR